MRDDDNNKPLEPDEVIDPASFARPVTANIGASADFAGRRSIDDEESHLRDQVLKHQGKVEEWPRTVLEVFANLYDPGEVSNVEDASPFAQAVMQALQMSPAFPDLRSAASAHRVVAAEATTGVCMALGNALGLDKIDQDEAAAVDPRDRKESLESLEEWLRECGANEDAISDHLKAAAQDFDRADALRARCLASLARNRRGTNFNAMISRVADRAAHLAKAVAVARSFGLGGGASIEDGDDGIDEELLRMLSDNQDLLKILEECGRMRRAAEDATDARSVEGRLDVVGVRPDDDLSRLVPSELALLDDEDLGDATMRRLVDGETLCWEMEGQEPMDSGDMILCVDRSGSMVTDRMIYARAVAAALATGAIAQGRRVVLTMFDHTQQTVRCDGPGGVKNLLKTLGLPACGGTRVPEAIDASLKAIENLREPDVIIVTDGYFPPSDQLKKSLSPLEEAGGRVFGVFIDTDGDIHEEWMANVWSVRSGDGKEIEIINSIDGGKKSDGKYDSNALVKANQTY